jgi:hypothetical protein
MLLAVGLGAPIGAEGGTAMWPHELTGLGPECADRVGRGLALSSGSTVGSTAGMAAPERGRGEHITVGTALAMNGLQCLSPE